MRKKKVYLSQVNPRKADGLIQFIPALMGEVVYEAIMRFGLPGLAAESVLVDLFKSQYVAKDTVIAPMTSDRVALVNLINLRSGISLSVEEVDMVGIDVGSESVTWVSPKDGMRVYGLTGSPAMQYRNVSGNAVELRMLRDSKLPYRIDPRFSLYESLQNALAILKAYEPSTLQQEIPA